jgi:hypothetical protein
MLNPVTEHLRTDVPIPLAVRGHFQPAPFYLTADMFGGVPVQIAAAELSARVGRPIAEPHTHPVDEVYLFLSPNPGGCTVRVHLAKREYTVRSPATFHIPAGALHCFEIVSAEFGSYACGVLLGTEA